MTMMPPVSRELGYTPDQSILTDALAWCRVIKSEGEKSELRKAARTASLAHREVMKSIRPGMNECELQAIHEFTCTRSGMRHQPYSGIFASGVGAAVLHYVENNRFIGEDDLFPDGCGCGKQWLRGRLYPHLSGPGHVFRPPGGHL